MSDIFQKEDIKHITVTVSGSAVNDLGQVLIFSRDKENNEFVFVKEFYSSFKDRAAQRRDMLRYRKKIRRLHNKKVSISYFENRAGNLVISEISRL